MSLVEREQTTCPVNNCTEPEKCSVLKRASRTRRSFPHLNSDLVFGMVINGLIIDRKLKYPDQLSAVCVVLPVV